MMFQRELTDDELATLQYVADKHNAYLDQAAVSVADGEETVQHETALDQLNRIITNAIAQHAEIRAREEEEAHLAEWRAAKG